MYAYIYSIPMTKEEKKPLNLSLPKEKIKEIQIQAIREEKTQSDLLEDAFDFYLENKDKVDEDSQKRKK